MLHNNFDNNENFALLLIQQKKILKHQRELLSSKRKNDHNLYGNIKIILYVLISRLTGKHKITK